MTSLLPLR